MRNFSKYLLGLCFFVGGATSLVLQVAWAKELSYSLGNTLYAVSTSIAAFMAGLAFGSHLASRYLGAVRHPVLVYAGLQLLIGLFGALSIPVLRATPPLLVGLHDVVGEVSGLFFVSRLAVVFVLMLLPVTLMGMTLPLMAGVFGRAKERYDFETGILYGVNTFGAVSGCLLAGFVMIPKLGLLDTCLVTGAVDALVGLASLALYPALRGAVALPGAFARADAGERRPLFTAQGLVGLLYLVSGGIAIVLEVSWFRFLAYVFGPTADAFSVMLALYLVGIGLGSVVGARLERHVRNSMMLVVLLELAIALVVLLGTAVYNDLPGWYGTIFLGLPDRALLSALLAQSAIAAVVVLPATLLMGALFPVVVRCYAEVARVPRDPEHTVGRLYALNTVGGILGSFLAGFWLLPSFGIWQTQLTAASASLLVGMAFLVIETEASQRRRMQVVGASVAIFTLLVATVPRLDFLALNKGSYLALANRYGFKTMMRDYYDAGRRLLFYSEGVNNSVAVTANDGNTGNLYLRVSGKPVADTRMTGRAHLVLLGQLPFLLARDVGKAAVIGFGTGVTTGSSLTHSKLESLKLAELESGVLEASVFFRYRNHDPFSDPRLDATVEDGRTFLFYSDELFDVITTDPISPIVAGAANLYTTDFYRLAASRLAPGGVFTQWLETWIPSEQTLKGILASMLDAFPHVAVFLIGVDYAIVGSNDPIVIPWDEFVARYDEPAVRADLARIQIRSPEQLMGYFLGGTKTVRAYVGDARPNTDDHNWLERRMPFELNLRQREDALMRGIAAMGRGLASQRLAELRALSPGLPMAEILRATTDPPPPTFPDNSRRLLMEGYAQAFKRSGERELAQQAQRHLANWNAPEVRSITKEQYQALFDSLTPVREAERRDEEERILRRLLEYPTREHYYAAGMGLARLLVQQQRHAEALEIARLMQEEFVAREQAFALEARVLRAMGRHQEARVAARRGLVYNPASPTLLAFLKGATPEG